MNISTNTFLRRGIAGAALAAAITAAGSGFAVTAHADDIAPAPAIEAPAIDAPAPAPVAPWLPTIDRWTNGYWPGHIHCGFPGWRGPFRCWY
ncbi:hypothetical protein [Mycobacterium sp. 94-17]|uniref:hypothetical protein n=1 Tax=Mycobacterium sp. 94-17 TaxID=2986147 RepID=UPI002D1E5030|nr:hypothetical protein [Mycobacterium sp. 94-17]MEB4211373.1 hypothetical protein [Mycobacterium sp. 94-17]